MHSSLFTLVILLLATANVLAETYTVNSQYMELKTAAGRAQPIFSVVEKDETFFILKKKTDWLKVKSESGSAGWVSQADFFRAIGRDGYNERINYVSSKWESGFSGGKFGSENSYGISVGKYFLPEILVSVNLSKASGAYSSSTIGTGDFTLHLYRHYIVSPFISIATGFMSNTPRQVLVNAQDQTQVIYSYGGGLSLNPYKNVSVRLTVRDYYLADVKENYYDWRLGVFGVFF